MNIHGVERDEDQKWVSFLSGGFLQWKEGDLGGANYHILSYYCSFFSPYLKSI